ncbi:MAG TPA: PAS domain S-box protein [Rhizomicrobium sp.]
MSVGRLGKILDCTADAGFATNREGVIRVWNRSAERLLGYGASEALNTTCADLLSCHTNTSPHCKQCGVISQCILGSTIPNYDTKVRTASGALIWINVSIIVYQNEQNDGDLLVVHLVRDITRQKEAAQLSQQLVELVRQIAQTSRIEERLAPILPLTEQEHSILRDIGEGKHPTVVARERQITPGTLRNHLHKVNQKLGTRNRLEAVLEAKRRGVI